MRIALFACALTCACSFEHGQLGTADGRTADAGDGAPCKTFSKQFDTCALTASGDLELAGAHTFDTGSGQLDGGDAGSVSVMGRAGPLRALVVRDFHLMASATLRATGPIPFAIVAFGTVTIDAGAVLDVSDGGAGARPNCAAGATTGTPATGESGGGGGGGGGGYGAAGGGGGVGDSDGDDNPGGAPGAAVPQPAGPLGGCPGANGGVGDNPPGTGGAGGGAIYIVAQTDITTAGGIHAGGGAGIGGFRTSGNGDAGGGGGGSGGLVWLEAPRVRNTGTIAANGGGGGEASGNSQPGNPGQVGQLSILRALAGSGSSPTGTDGGAGGAKGNPGGDSVTNSQAGGGGGGGGGAGFVVVESPDAMLGTNVSP